jgi:hypothetical protein
MATTVPKPGFGRRQQIFWIDTYDFMQLAKACQHKDVVARLRVIGDFGANTLIPEDAKLLDAIFDFSRGAFGIKVEHPSFPLTPEGEYLEWGARIAVELVEVPVQVRLDLAATEGRDKSVWCDCRTSPPDYKAVITDGSESERPADSLSALIEPLSPASRKIVLEQGIERLQRAQQEWDKIVEATADINGMLERDFPEPAPILADRAGAPCPMCKGTKRVESLLVTGKILPCSACCSVRELG